MNDSTIDASIIGYRIGSEGIVHAWVGGDVAAIAFELAPQPLEVGQAFMLVNLCLRVIAIDHERQCYLVSRALSMSS